MNEIEEEKKRLQVLRIMVGIIFSDIKSKETLERLLDNEIEYLESNIETYKELYL